MTDTPVEEVQPEEDEPEEPVSANCRWCGAYQAEADGDWLCQNCERYQDAMVCPTCGGLARVSAMPAELIPAPVKPKKQKGE